MKRSPGLGRPTRPPSRTWPFKQFEQFKRFKPLERFHPVAKQAFVSITVARQRGNRTPFRFFIPVFFVFTCYCFPGLNSLNELNGLNRSSNLLS